MDYNELLHIAERQINEVPINGVFVVKDLFTGTMWTSLPTGVKLGFGRFFKNKVTSGTIANIEYIGKIQNNSARYQKIS